MIFGWGEGKKTKKAPENPRTDPLEPLASITLDYE